MTKEIPSLPRGLMLSSNDARLPAVYEQAQAALSECYRIDECKQWSDKAAALASYARQARDNTLYETAQKIHGRAIKRVGELLAQIEAKHTGRPAEREKELGGAPPLISEVVSPPTRKQAAADAGLSRDQARQALRVAAVPAAEFEAMIEQSPPATVTAIAERGKKEAPKPFDYLKGRAPADFRVATQALGHLRHFHESVSSVDPEQVARGWGDVDTQRVRDLVPPLLSWLTELLTLAQENDQ